MWTCVKCCSPPHRVKTHSGTLLDRQVIVLSCGSTVAQCSGYSQFKPVIFSASLVLKRVNCSTVVCRVTRVGQFGVDLVR